MPVLRHLCCNNAASDENRLDYWPAFVSGCDLEGSMDEPALIETPSQFKSKNTQCTEELCRLALHHLDKLLKALIIDVLKVGECIKESGEDGLIEADRVD